MESRFAVQQQEDRSTGGETLTLYPSHSFRSLLPLALRRVHFRQR